MKILRIRIENLNSLKLKQTIDFSTAPLNDTGLFAITGDTGAGKTTLLDAITLALYGRVHRNKDVTEVMSYGATESLAEVEFESGKGLFRAKWSTYRSRRKPDGNIQPPRRELAQWDEQKQDFRIIAEKIREVDTKVEEISGLDYDRFTRSVLLSQGDFAAFLQAGERERSDLLERITGTDVYTRISIAAYERFKAEQHKLEDLRKEQEALQLLGEQEVEEIQKQLENHRTRSVQLRNELNTTRKQVQWYRQKQEIEENLETLRGRELNLIERREAFQPEQARLHAHQRAYPHRPLLERCEETENRLKALDEEVEQLKSEEQGLKDRLESLEKQVQESQLTYGDRQQQKKRQFPVLDQVIALDKELSGKEAAWRGLQEDAQALEKEMEEIEQQRSRLHRDQENQKQELKRTANWLEEHADWANLSELLPIVERKREEMRTVVEEKKRYERQKSELEQQREQQEQQRRALNRQLDQARETLAQLNEAFQRELPAGYGLGRNELLRNLHQDIERLGEQQKQLQQLQQFTSEYQDLLQELMEYEAQVESLNSRETALDKEVISAMDELDWTRQQLEFHQQIYEQQQLIANYEKDRHRLVEGDPCPLCQSTHHPFREHPVKPFVDRARSAYEKSRQAYDRLLNRQNQLLSRQKEIKIQKDHLMGSELQELGGQMARQLQRIELIESRVADMILGLGAAHDDQDRGPALAKKIAEAEVRIHQKKLTRDRLLEISDQLDQQENKVQELEKALQEKENALQIQLEKIRNADGHLEEVENRYGQQLKEVGAIFEQFGQQFDPATAREGYRSLKGNHESFVAQSNQRVQLQQEIALIGEKLIHLQELETREKDRFQKLARRTLEQEREVQELRKERQKLLGDRDPVQEKEALEQSLESLGSVLNDLKEQRSGWNSEWQGILSLLKTRQKEQQKLTGQLNSWQDQLSKAAERAGFADHNALFAALLSEEEAGRLLQEWDELEKEILTITQSRKDQEAALKRLEDVETVETPLEDLMAHLAVREEDFQSLQQTIGGLTERLVANEKQQKTAGKLVHKIARQEKEFTRWAHLNEIIGQADGKKFRIFAQGLTLTKLVELANYHLESLNGRYLIRKRSDENLELEIIDTFQADNARSMNTLSGGESFLVSLSLALGLSDLAGRDAHIQSLFIDEGFGTLDENSLDMAIDTLENLQANGKTIGIISHVKALKERIGTQIQVTKKGTGFSDVRIVG